MIAEFFAMGGYASFVWPAYGICAIIMAGLASQSWQGLKSERATLENLQATRKSHLSEPEGHEVG